MDLEKGSNQLGVCDYFDNPINNKTALKCYGDINNIDYSGFDSDLNKYLNEKSISEMIKINSEIERILSKFKISIKINMNILHNLVQNHLPHTKNIAIGIAKNLSKERQKQVNQQALAQATSLHDIAKVIIPEGIVNKAGALTNDEREIMHEHARLSYEMLKTTDLNKETLDLIKNHHNSCNSDINLQILSISDIYSALREKRSYKNEMTKEEALDILNKETQRGKFHQDVFEALVKYANKEDSNNINSKRQVFNLKPVNSFCS